MTREIFGRGVQMLNSVIPENKNIVDEKLDVYYLILKEYSDKDYLAGIEDLLRHHKLEFGAPSPATIIEYVEKNADTRIIDEIFRRIKTDILLLGVGNLKYEESIQKALEEIGGIEVLASASEGEINNLKKEFAKAYKEKSLERSIGREKFLK